jgi:NAD(P)-dependent dehydrogenase (short-subunit alcohol dehydrogenase family)
LPKPRFSSLETQIGSVAPTAKMNEAGIMRTNARTALITGGERGIGRAVAERLLVEGYRVLVAGIDEAAAEVLLDENSAGDASLRFLRCDVGVEAEVAATVEAVIEWTGRLDLLVSNAGIADPHAAPPSQLALEVWEKVIRTNLTGGFLIAKHALPHLAKVEGSIVFIASTRALMSEPHTEAYAASKGGLVALTHALAASVGPQVRVNAISPGWIHHGSAAELSPTDHAQHPAGRVGQGGDIADAVLYLAHAGFVTGQNLVVDGGMTKKMIYE